jgi:hypothetical protein
VASSAPPGVQRLANYQQLIDQPDQTTLRGLDGDEASRIAWLHPQSMVDVKFSKLLRQATATLQHVQPTALRGRAFVKASGYERTGMFHVVPPGARA